LSWAIWFRTPTGQNKWPLPKKDLAWRYSEFFRAGKWRRVRKTIDACVTTRTLLLVELTIFKKDVPSVLSARHLLPPFHASRP